MWRFTDELHPIGYTTRETWSAVDTSLYGWLEYMVDAPKKYLEHIILEPEYEPDVPTLNPTGFWTNVVVVDVRVWTDADIREYRALGPQWNEAADLLWYTRLPFPDGHDKEVTVAVQRLRSYLDRARTTD